MIPEESGQGLKPTWRGLRSGGLFRTPLIEFAGKLEGWKTDPNNFGGIDVKLKFTHVYVIRSDSHYPSSEGEVSVKYSDQENSGWGRLGVSIAEVLGVARDILDLDSLVGQYMQMVRLDDVDFGFEDKDGKRAKGSVWNMVKLLKPGEAPVPTTAAAVPMPAPRTTAAQPTRGLLMTSANVDNSQPGNPEERALSLLHARNIGEFFQVVLPDPLVKQDSRVIQGVMANTLVEAWKASGKVTQNPDGTFTVLGQAIRVEV